MLDGFTTKYPNVTVEVQRGGRQHRRPCSRPRFRAATRPTSRRSPQPGTIEEYAKQGKLQPIDFAKDTVAANFGQSIVDLGTVDGKLYSFLFKGANKSTVWYNVPVFQDAGVEPPKTWDEFLAGRADAQGVGRARLLDRRRRRLDAHRPLREHLPPHGRAGEVRPARRRTRSRGRTSRSRTRSPRWRKILGDTDNIAGGTTGALQTDFPTSVTQVFADPPKAAMVIEADFVAGRSSTRRRRKPETGFNVFDFPSINGSPPAVVGGGDQVVMFKDSPAAQALVEYLATPEAAEIWVKRGGFSSPNKNVDRERLSRPDH